MRAWLRGVRFPVGVWAALATLLVVLQHVSNRVTRDPGYSFFEWRGLRNYLDGWSQFDGPEYQQIAEFGYTYTAGVESPVVWFPAYPLTVRWVERLVGDYLLAGIAVAAVFGLAASVLFWKWLTAQQMDGARRTVAFLTLLLYPYGWYLFGVVHSDAMFLAWTISAFLLVERRHYVWAGVLGALATATRPTGLAVIPGLFVLGLERGGVLVVPPRATGLVAKLRLPVRIDRTRWRMALAGPLLACAGVGAYMTFLWVNWGHPLLFIINQRTYHPSDWPILKRPFFSRWLHIADHPTYTLTITAQALFALLVLISIPRVARRFGWGYGVFLAVLVAIPTISTADFMGTGRYLMAAFPVAAVWGEWLADRPRARVAWLSVSAVALVGLSMGFARSWYLT